jgi:hypothetical protein
MKRILVRTAGLALAGLAVLPATAASAQPASRLGMIQDYEATVFTGAHPALGSYFWDKPSSYENGSRMAEPSTTRLARFTSLASFRRASLRSGSWAMLDLESWSAAVPSEAAHPAATMKAFNRLATARGINVIEAPSLDLAITDRECASPGGTGGSVKWYRRCHIAAAAASHGAKIVVVQTQSQQPDRVAYAALYHAALAQVGGRAAAYAAISQTRDGGSVRDAVADVLAVRPAGLFVSCPRGGLGWEAAVLRQLQAAGY